MTHALTLDGRDFALELHQLLREFDPAAVRDDLTAALRERLEGLSNRVSELLEATSRDRAHAALHERLSVVKRALDEHASRLAQRGRSWRSSHRQLQMAYQQLAEGLRTFEVHMPALRPTNYTRNLFHILGGLTAVALVELVSPATLVWIAVAFCVSGWTMEIGRRVVPGLNARLMVVFGKVAHPHEWHRVNSSTWFTTALLALTLTGEPFLCAIGCGVLALSDPAAALVGRRYGRTKLVNGRSLEGTLTFFVVALAVGTAIAIGFHGVAIGPALLIAGAAALTSALVELFSRRIDDNLTIPLTAAGTAWAVVALLGVTL